MLPAEFKCNNTSSGLRSIPPDTGHARAPLRLTVSQDQRPRARRLHILRARLLRAGFAELESPSTRSEAHREILAIWSIPPTTIPVEAAPRACSDQCNLMTCTARCAACGLRLTLGGLWRDKLE